MADIRVKDLSESAVPGADYFLLTDSATDGVKKVKTSNIVSKADIGLGNVDNTSDAGKPVSTATQTALDAKANSADLGGLATKNAVAISDITASGTASSGTYLRGDGQWITPAGAGDMLKSAYDPTNQFADAFDSANQKFLQTGTGAVARTVRQKLCDTVNIVDFGAVATGDVADAATNAAALTYALAISAKVIIPWSPLGFHFGTNQIEIGAYDRVVGESQALVLSTATTSLFLMSGGGTGSITPDTSGVEGLTIDMDGSGSSSSAFLINTLPGGTPTVVSHLRISNIKCRNCVSFYMEPTGGSYLYNLEVDNIECILTRGTQIYSKNTQGFIRWRNINIDNTITGQIAVTWVSAVFTKYAGLELSEFHVTGEAVAKGGGATFVSGATGIIFQGVGTNVGKTFIWLNQVRCEASQGHGIQINDTDFIYFNELETFGVLGNAISFTNCNYIQGTNIYTRGAYLSPGAASSANGITFESCGQVSGTRTGGGVLSNVAAESCTGHGLLVKNSMGFQASSLRVQDNVGYGIKEEETTAGYCNFNTYTAADLFGNTAGNMLLIGGQSMAPAAILNSRRSATPVVTSNNNISLTTAVAANITSISLAPGDWDISALANFDPASTTKAYFSQISISGTSASIDTALGRCANFSYISTGEDPYDGYTQVIPPVRISLSSTTTIYLTALARFDTSTMSVAGIINARRAA